MRRRTFLASTARGAVGFGILRHLAACGTVRTPATGAMRTDTEVGDRFMELRDRYFIRHLEFNPVTSTYLGGDAYSPVLRESNARLRNYRHDALMTERDFYRRVERERQTIDPARLSPQDAIDYGVLGAQVSFLLHQIDDLRYYERAVDTYVAEPFRGVDWQIQQMTDVGGGMLGTEQEWELLVRRLEAVPSYLAAARENLLAGKSTHNIPDKRMVERDGITGSQANAEYFRTTLPKLSREYLGARPFATTLVQRLGPPTSAAADAFTHFAEFLGRTFDTAEHADRFAAGEKEYEFRLKNFLRERRSAKELYEYGARQVELYEGRIYDVAREIAGQAHLSLRFRAAAQRRANVRAVMDYLAGDSPRNDDELLQWYVAAGERAVAYGRQQRLFDIPPTYRLDVVSTPPVLRSTVDAAYYPAPPFKKSGVGRFYLTPTNNDPAALKLNNRASVADTAVHEGFPGHDWHYKYMTEHASQISNIRWLTPGAVEDSSSMWEDSMATEGWALYSEELMAEPTPTHPYGFYTPAEYLYELQGQLLRAVRVRVDVGIHTGRMTFDQAVDYFTEHVSFFPNACARAESDPLARAVCDDARRALYRYSKWPTQAITYNLGKSAIADLRRAYQRRQGSRYSAKAFHEKFMRMGTIPVGYFADQFLSMP